MEDMEKKLAFLLATNPCISLAGTYGTYARAARDLTNNGVVVREKGEWMNVTGGMVMLGDCSSCHTRQPVIGTYYCKNCGADMRKGENG